MTITKNSSHGIRDLPTSDLPRERLAKLGVNALNTSELLAILLRIGVRGENVIRLAERLLRTFYGLHGLHMASIQDLSAIRGVGLAKAAQIKAALELGHRMSMETLQTKPLISSPDDVSMLLKHTLTASRQEELWVLNLDTRNRVISNDRLYLGSLNHSTVRISEVFESAIRQKANGIIVVHNHPSGDPSPSPEDVSLTKTLIEAGNLLDIKVLDHVIIGSEGFVSLKQRKLGFN